MAAKFTCPYCGTRQEIDPDIIVDEQECVRCGKLMVEEAISERPLRRRVRRKEEDDWDDDYPVRRQSTTVPGAAVAAGIIWIVFGCLSVLGAIFQVVRMLVEREVDAEGAYKTGRAGGMFCGAAIGAAFIRAGIQTIRGTADDVQGNAIGSLLLGGLYALLGLLALFVTSIDFVKYIGLIALFLAVALFAAGAMALAARSDYLESREKPRRRRRRRR